MENNVSKNKEKTVTISKVIRALKQINPNLKPKYIYGRGRSNKIDISDDYEQTVPNRSNTKIGLYNTENPNEIEIWTLSEIKKELSKKNFEKERANVSSEELNRKMSENNVGAKIDGRSKKAADKALKTQKKPEINLTCTKNKEHKFKKNLSQILQAIKDQLPLCNKDGAGTITKFEKDLSKELENGILKELFPNYDWTGKVNYGQNGKKQISGIKTDSGRMLDYDIYFELPERRNGYDAVAIMVDGPAHNSSITYWKTRKNDIRRILEVQKRNRNLKSGEKSVYILPVPVATAKDDESLNKEENLVYKHILKSQVKDYLRKALIENNAKGGVLDQITKTKERFGYDENIASEKEKEEVTRKVNRQLSGYERQRKAATDPLIDLETAVMSTIYHLKRTKPNQITYRKKKWEDKRLVDTDETTNLYSFLASPEGEESLKNNAAVWAELTKPTTNPRIWINNHQGYVGQIRDYKDKNSYPSDTKGIKLFEEIKKRTSK